jgi:hypothetical protein
MVTRAGRADAKKRESRRTSCQKLARASSRDTGNERLCIHGLLDVRKANYYPHLIES